MIFKETLLFISDKTSVKILKTFHLYKGFSRKVSFEGFGVKGSALKVKPPVIEYKGFKRKYIKKGDICRSLIIKTNKLRLNTNNKIQLKTNSSILLKKKNVTRSKYFFGLVSKSVNRKKIITLFPNFF